MIANIIAAKIYIDLYEKSYLPNKMLKSHRKENNGPKGRTLEHIT